MIFHDDIFRHFSYKKAEKHPLSKITPINKQTNIQKTLQFQITRQKKST